MPVVTGNPPPKELTSMDNEAVSPASSDSLLILHNKTENQNRLILLRAEEPKETTYGIHEMHPYPLRTPSTPFSGTRRADKCHISEVHGTHNFSKHLKTPYQPLLDL